jgi:hypothetical protein
VVIAPAVSGAQSPSRTYGVFSCDSGTATRNVPRSSGDTQARRLPLGSNTAEVPLIATSTAGRPDSTARTASKLACCWCAQVP